MSLHRHAELDIGQDLPFQYRSWRIQRLGWAIMALIFFAAVIGLFGEGPLSHATAEAHGLFNVQYERFARHGAPVLLEIKLEPGAVQGNEAHIWIDREYLQGVQIQTVYPEADRVRAGADRITYIFELEQPSNPSTIIFNIMYEPIGLHRDRIGLGDQGAVTFSQFVYP